MISSCHWCIVTVKKADASYMKVLLPTDAFTEEEELKICIGLTLCVLVYTARDADRKETCKILTFDETVPSASNQ